MSDLRESFHAERTEQSELEQLLQIHFGLASAPTAEEIQYSRQGEAPALILRYDKDGELARIEPGPALSPDDVVQISDKVQRFLLDGSETNIGQLVLFSSVPMSGYFQYHDAFRLLPVPPDAPRPKFFMAQHPMLLQYRFTGSQESLIKMLRSSRIGRELDLLCTALTIHIQGAMPPKSRYNWSLLPGGGAIAATHSEYCQEGYVWSGANGLVPHYASLDALEPVRRLPAQEYFNSPGISVGQQLTLPDNFDELLDAYFTCTADNRDKFMRASFWYQYAQRAGRYSRSGAYNALVSAVEALTPSETSDGVCACCKRPFGAGLTKRFTEFVEQHAPAPGVTAKERRELYVLRSALSHGGQLLHADRFTWGGMTASYLNDMNKEHGLWRLVRLVLVNWLLARK